MRPARLTPAGPDGLVPGEVVRRPRLDVVRPDRVVALGLRREAEQVEELVGPARLHLAKRHARETGVHASQLVFLISFPLSRLRCVLDSGIVGFVAVTLPSKSPASHERNTFVAQCLFSLSHM